MAHAGVCVSLFFARRHWSLVWSQFDFFVIPIQDVEHVPNSEIDSCMLRLLTEVMKIR